MWVLAAGVPYAPLGHQAVDGGKYTLAFLTGGHPLAGQLDELIERCTRTDPDLRPSMAQMSQDLKAWMEMSERRSRGEANDPLRDVAATSSRPRSRTTSLRGRSRLSRRTSLADG